MFLPQLCSGLECVEHNRCYATNAFFMRKGILMSSRLGFRSDGNLSNVWVKVFFFSEMFQK